MNQQTAERWVVVSAAVTAGVYFYRLFTEGSAPPVTAKRVAGLGKPVVPLGAFATAWGFTYLVLALMAQAAPGLGGGFAILIGAADFLANTGSIVADVGAQEATAGGKGLTTAVTLTGSSIATGGLDPIEGIDTGISGILGGVGSVATGSTSTIIPTPSTAAHGLGLPPVLMVR